VAFGGHALLDLGSGRASLGRIMLAIRKVRIHGQYEP
jgi:hypothetical protein